jgi:protocatechuate 3,4-dioxygenase beta subunit
MKITGKAFAFLLLCYILLTGILFAEDPTIIPNGSMRGFVYVLDGISELHPIPGALVELFGASETGEIITISPIASIHAEENGFYYFSELVSAPYMARVSKDGYQMRMEMVFVLPDHTLRKDFFLVPSHAPTPNPADTGVFKGVVSEDVGWLAIVPPPIPQAHVLVYKYSNLTQSDSSKSIFLREAYTDINGLYQIPDLPYGTYTVIVEAKTFFPHNKTVNMDKPEVLLDFSLIKFPEPTPIPVGGIFGVVLGMDEGSSTTHPVSGAVVEAFGPFWDCVGKDKCIMPPVARAITDEKGFYIMGQVPSGSWEVVARAEGFLPESGLVDVMPDEETERNFLLSPGETPREGEIYGYVHGGIPEGVLALIPFNALSGAKIEVFNTLILNTTNMEPFPDPGEPIAVTYADEMGNYRIIGLAVDRYYLIRASHEKYFTGYKTIIIYNEPLQLNFFLDPIPNPTPAGSVIRGRVFEQSSGDSMLNPLFGVLIIIQRIGENSSSGDLPAPIILYTDGEGKYLADNLESGYYVIQAQTVGYYPQFRHVLLGENEAKIVHFVLTPIGTEPPPPPDSGSLSGHVSGIVPDQIDQETSPIAGALVSVYPTVSSASGWPDIQPLFRAMTNEEGIYEIPGIPPGIYLVAAEAPGYERCIDKADVPPGDNVTLDFRLKPVIVPIPTPETELGNLAGQALGMESEGIFKPLPGAHILVFPAQIIHEENLPAPIRRCFTDEEGTFLFENLRAGDYLVMACAKGFEPGALPAAVLEGETSRIAFKLLPAPQPSPTPAPYPGELDGHVAFEREGTMIPIPSAQVLAIHMYYESSDMLGDLPVRHTATDEFGYYHFADLRTGSYLVTVKAQGFYPAQDHAEVFPKEVATLNFILKPEDQPTTETGAIIGKVMTVDASTSPALIPLMDADIIVLRVINTLEVGEILIPAGRAVTDEMGAYTVENLRTGIYTVIAQKAGYSWGVKKARVKPFAKTEVNFLLVPTGQSEPADLQTDLYESHFNDNAENWQTGGAPGFFLEPEAECHEGALRLHCSNNQQTFGFWHSPSDAIPVKPGMIYKAIFALSSDIADPAKAPCIRIRFNSQSEQIADMVVINSKGDAALSPGPDGRIYNFYFTPPRQEYCLPESENDIYASFDLVNMDIGDAEEATISLDWVKIESLSRENLPAGSEAASLDFSMSSQGWTTQFAAGFFDPPLARCPPDAEGLVLKAANNTSTFGAWVSPASLVQMKANTLYEVTWRIYSDQADSSTVPGIRIRAGDEFNRLIAQKCIFSNAEGDNSPTPAGGLYTIYYTATQEMDELGMYLAFDIVNMNSSDAPEGAIGLQNVSVKAIPLE